MRGKIVVFLRIDIKLLHVMTLNNLSLIIEIQTLEPKIYPIKMFFEWALLHGEMRMVEDIPFPELDGLLARFKLGMFTQN